MQAIKCVMVSFKILTVYKHKKTLFFVYFLWFWFQNECCRKVLQNQFVSGLCSPSRGTKITADRKFLTGAFTFLDIYPFVL